MFLLLLGPVCVLILFIQGKFYGIMKHQASMYTAQYIEKISYDIELNLSELDKMAVALQKDAAVEQALRVGPVYAAAFLGDGLSDFAAVQPLLMEAGALCHAVRGNNDWGSREELAVSFLVNGVRFYACHGHEWHVKYGLDRLWNARLRWLFMAIRTTHRWIWNAACTWSIPARCATATAWPMRTSVWRRTAACASAFANGNRKREGVPGWAASACRKSSPAAIFSDRTRFPCAFSAAGETRRETLLRKASESTAHVAGFGFHLEGCGPPNLLNGFLTGKPGRAGLFRQKAGSVGGLSR